MVADGPAKQVQSIVACTTAAAAAASAISLHAPVPDLATKQQFGCATIIAQQLQLVFGVQAKGGVKALGAKSLGVKALGAKGSKVGKHLVFFSISAHLVHIFIYWSILLL